MYFLEDFDNDGTSECIGLTVSEITIFQEAENAVNLLTGNFQIPEDFLKKFSRYNFDGFCLGMCYLIFVVLEKKYHDDWRETFLKQLYWVQLLSKYIK